MTDSRDNNFDEQPWRQQSRRRDSNAYEHGSGYSHFDEGASRSRARSTRRSGGSVDAFGEDGRINSVYRPASGRSQYSRSSNRYTSANAQRQRDQRSGGPRSQSHQQVPRRQHDRRAERVHYEQRSMSATRYSRDHYVSHEGQGRARSVSQQSYEAAMRREKPVNPRIFVILGVLAAVLLAIIVVRFVASGSTTGEYAKLQASITQEQTQLKELEVSTSEVQTQMDSWQETIDKYNKSKK